MNLLKFVNETIANSTALIRGRHSFSDKIKIWAAYAKLTFKLTINRIFKIRDETLLGLKVSGFNYILIRFLFGEIFLRDEYFFITKKKNPVILDCGANIGVATLYFKWIYPGSKIYSFEPDKETFSLLEKNIKQNSLSDVSCFNSALSDRNGKLDFFIDKKNSGLLGMSTKAERHYKDRVVVDSIKLSHFLKTKLKEKEVDFLKMDVEGEEIKVIKDLVKNNMLKKIKEGVIEYHHKFVNHRSELGAFLSMFEKQGFEYQISTSCVPISSKGKFQDVLIYFYRS
jgi:FkbM family methyltransferase